MKFQFSRQNFSEKKKSSNIKFHENSFIGSRVDPYGQTDERTDRRTDMTKLIVALRNFANALIKSPITERKFGDRTEALL